MFRNRNNSQKPCDELIEKFQKAYTGMIPNSNNASPFTQSPAEPKFNLDGSLKLTDTTPRGTQLAPSFIDPNSLSFMNPLNQPNGYYTPNSGGLGVAYHPQAGDLHTPTMGLSMMTPLSLPQNLAAGGMNNDGSTMGFNQFDQQFMPHQFQNPQPFQQQQASFAPGAFMHRDSGYDAMDETNEMPFKDTDMQGNANQMIVPTMQDMDQPDFDSASEKFRYHVTLRAATAMVKDHDEIPVSYLNKGQAYSVSLVDTAPPQMNSQPVKYRTFIRVSFQEEEQRKKPAACWQLWKEGRGSNEAHQRGGKLQAVEYVDPIQGGTEDQKKQVELESSSFDGFCVTWTANPTTGASDAAISVRFNFLSTDFSHSKGVKGIPVRFCAKTEMISPTPVESEPRTDAEVCYCQVKLFRDHGAERKLANDTAHVKKSIDKLKQQLSQADLGSGSYGKRKRASGSIALKNDSRPNKLTKHKRTWSMGSQDGAERMSVEDDLQVKLVLLQEMFTSTRSVSILSLRGEDQDDPDLYPVQLPDARDFSKKDNAHTGPRFNSDGTPVLQTLSPSTSTNSVNSPCPPASLYSSLYDSGYQGNTPTDSSQPGSDTPGSRANMRQPIKVRRVNSTPIVKKEGSSGAESSADGASSAEPIPTGFIEAVDIDPTYRPPSDRPPKPIACFYIRFQRGENQHDYYRAVYLTERTVRDLMEKIFKKQDLADPQRVVRVLHVNRNGLKIMVDDDVIRELPDGQDMNVEISEASASFESLVPSPDNMSPAVEVQLKY